MSLPNWHESPILPSQGPAIKNDIFNFGVVLNIACWFYKQIAF